MARKTTGTTTTRSKKTTLPPGSAEASPEIRKNGKAVSSAIANDVSGSLNLEEEIRRRAYELYLERRATATGDNGDENQDWFVAEREIRSRLSGQERQTA